MLISKNILFVAMCFLVSCAPKQPEFSSKDFGGKITVKRFSGGTATVEQEFLKGSPEFLEFTQWIEAHTNGWGRIMASYAPGTVVRAEKFEINFLPGTAVLDRWSTNNNTLEQWVLKLKNAEPNFIADRVDAKIKK